jgi:hypothetical protein
MANRRAPRITFSNQDGVDHGARWLRTLTQEQARAAIALYIQENAGSLSPGPNPLVIIEAGGIEVSANIFLRPDGTYNVGTYWEL